MGSELGTTATTKPEARVGGLGIFWIIFSITWTVILACGMTFLYAKRSMPILRIRGLPLSFAAVIMLHTYWLAVNLGYTYGALMPEWIEFWIMGIWFPFGIALFHASNSRFLYVANAQRKFTQKATDPGLNSSRPQIRKTIVARWRRLDYTKKTLFFVIIGMMFQLLLTVFTFLISRKFHDSFGIKGTEVTGTPMERKAAQGRGWEWWPSILWQMFWAWIVAPIILWRARGLRDTQGWRLQTICCCLSNLHAAPMWLIALYAPGMEKVNNAFIPPQWIALSIMLLEIFTIFIPCWEVRKQRTLCQETLDSIARWESRNKSTFPGANKSLHSDSNTSWVSRAGGKVGSVHSSAGGSILTMEALEHTLAKNPEPLQHFSALKDFSGENIAFLTRIREWRATFIVTAKPTEKHISLGKTESPATSITTKELTRECYESALSIYMDFISANSAEFQVNLSSQDFKNLQAIFENAARIIYGENPSPDPATPFDDAHIRDNDSKAELVRYWGAIPEEFDESVFDDAEMSIKYLVLTNTWPKFIKERRSFDASSGLEAAN